MRAISLTMAAFGPFCARQTIYFNELGNESIFLITGPTGAGKTTIFDAICYALYGRASGSERDQDSLRSHFAKIDQPTEVVFTFLLKDRQYEIVRRPKQQKKKARGEGFTEEPANAELYEYANNEKKLLTSRVKEVNESLEEKLGLDYEQFRKMIMIPQGEFRRLISENSKEREEILQKIFRTYFYQQITEELKKQSKELQQTIKQTEWKMEQQTEKIAWHHETIEETDDIPMTFKKLTAEITEDKDLIAKSLDAMEKQKALLETARKAFYEGKSLADKFEEKIRLTETKQQLTELLPEIKKEKEIVTLAQKATEIIPFEDQTESRKREWLEQMNKLKEQKATLVTLDKQYAQVKTKYDFEANREQERDKLKETVEKEKKQLDLLNQYVSLLDKKVDLEKQKKEAEGKKRTQQKRTEQLQAELEQIDREAGDYNQLTKDFYQAESDVKNTSEKINKLNQLLKENNKLTKMRENYLKAQKLYVKKQTDVENERQKIREMEEEQKKHQAYFLAQHLHNGEACPVCGSTEHPEKAIQASASFSIEELEKLQNTLTAMENSLGKAQNDFIDVKSEGTGQRQIVEQIYQEFEDDLSALDNQEITNKLQAWQEIVTERSKEKLKLDKEIKRLETVKNKREQLQRNLKETNNLLQTSNTEYEKVNNEWTKLQIHLEHYENELTDFDKNPKQAAYDVNEKQRKLTEWTQQWEKLQKEYQEIKEQIQQITTVVNQLETFAANTGEKYEAQVNLFEEKIKENGFQTKEEFERAKKSAEEQHKLQEHIKTFENKQSAVDERLSELGNHLEEKDPPDLAKLEGTVNNLDSNVQQTNEYIQNLKIRIQQNVHIQAELTSLQSELEHLSKDFFDIGELADLARGENHLKLSFERYVLSSFLDEILLQANIRMDQMTEHRYQLIRSGQVAKRGAQSGLDLEVLDHHTARQRSVKTLSGGEGFKAALSLALGMADVVQAHAGGVQLETLFIDEGFGTLDELSLEQAISCLKGLQKSNRILGIISHVPQLKEEIHAKLQITPSHEGSNLAFSFN